MSPPIVGVTGQQPPILGTAKGVNHDRVPADLKVETLSTARLTKPAARDDIVAAVTGEPPQIVQHAVTAVYYDVLSRE